jgi:hypothetical protein
MTSVVHFLSLSGQIDFCWISNDKDLSRWLLISLSDSLGCFQISRAQIMMKIQPVLNYGVVMGLT